MDASGSQPLQAKGMVKYGPKASGLIHPGETALRQRAVERAVPRLRRRDQLPRILNQPG